MTPEQRLWATAMMTRIDDAIYPFLIADDKMTLQEQFEAFKINTPILSSEKRRNIRRGMVFLESSQFDDVAANIGYGSLFVNRTFALVKGIIKMRNELYDELLMLPEQRKQHEIRVMQKIDELARRKSKSVYVKKALRGVSNDTGPAHTA